MHTRHFVCRNAVAYQADTKSFGTITQVVYLTIVVIISALTLLNRPIPPMVSLRFD